ncbi:hypothetical protein QQ045_010649 [Rhodiola kirilowii]
MQALIKLFLLSLAASYFGICRAADSNSITLWACTPKPANETKTAFQVNLNNLLITLQQQAPLNNGFYNTTSGENSDKLDGLAQCRGDLSAQDCASCLRDSVQVAFNTCTNSNFAALRFRWCFLRYSDKDSFGLWKGVLSAAGSGSDDPNVVAKGRNFMSALADSVPNEPLMYKTGFVDVADGSKRYGLAQCIRDLNKTSCGECLTKQVKFFNQNIGNQSRLEVSSYECNMWYNNYQFYFDNSVPTTGPPPPTPSASTSPPPPTTPSAATSPPPPTIPSASPRELQRSFGVATIMMMLLIFITS